MVVITKYKIMEKSELIDLLKGNLKVETSIENEYANIYRITTTVMFGDVKISKTISERKMIGDSSQKY